MTKAKAKDAVATITTRAKARAMTIMATTVKVLETQTGTKLVFVTIAIKLDTGRKIAFKTRETRKITLFAMRRVTLAVFLQVAPCRLRQLKFRVRQAALHQ